MHFIIIITSNKLNVPTYVGIVGGNAATIELQSIHTWAGNTTTTTHTGVLLQIRRMQHHKIDTYIAHTSACTNRSYTCMHKSFIYMHAQIVHIHACTNRSYTCMHKSFIYMHAQIVHIHACTNRSYTCMHKSFLYMHAQIVHIHACTST